MECNININGILVRPEEAKISIFDRGFLFGDSIYEVTRTHKRKPVLFEEHLDRLLYSAKRISMDLAYSREELRIEVEKTINSFEFDGECYIRLIITRGEGGTDLDPTGIFHQNLIVIVKPLAEKPKEWFTQGVKFIIADTRRNPENSLDPSAKTGNYLNNVMAHIEAKKQRAFDSIMLNQEGFIAEGTTNNIWVVKNGEFYTPPLKAGILKGITRESIFRIAEKEGFKVRELFFKPEDLKTIDEMFCTSSTREIVPITQVDDLKIGKGVPGEMTLKLRQAYLKFVEERC